MFSVFSLHLLAFLLGSIPIGYLIAKAKGVDVRSTGSGNVGATNVSRAAGKAAGILTLVGDALKGILACTLLPTLAAAELAVGAQLQATLGFAAIIGHCYSPFLKFRGGKGVATSLGVFLVLSPIATACSALVFFVVFLGSRFVSLASIIAALAHPLAFWLTSSPGETAVTLFVSIFVSLLIIIRHQHNLQRLVAGEEKKFF